MSIANNKDTSMTPLEFQGLGKAFSSTMLIQPLISKASTYNCHITNYQLDLGTLSAIPAGLPLISIMGNPFLTYKNNADVRASLGLGGGDAIPDGTAVGQIITNAYSLIDDWDENVDWDEDNTYETIHRFLNDQDTNDLIGKRTNDYFREIDDTNLVSPVIYSPSHSQSSTDFVWLLSNEVRKISGDVYTKTGTDAQNATRMWIDKEEDNVLIRLCVNLRGVMHMRINTELFRAGYIIVFSHQFRKLTGSKHDFMIPAMMWDGGAIRATWLYTTQQVRDFEEHWPLMGNQNLIYAELPHDKEVEIWLGENIFELGDVRQQIILDCTLPIDKTLRMDSEKEEIRHQLQEFELEPGKIEIRVDMFGAGIKQRQFAAPRVILKNSQGLAVKKLFEGQMQAFRIEQRLRIRYWDLVKKEITTKLSDIEYDQGMFFYLKLLFCKEVV